MGGPTEPGLDERVLTGEIWDVLVERIAALRDLVWGDDLPDDPVVRAEGARYLLRFLAAGLRVCVELDDPDYPVLGDEIENRVSWGLDNPDARYHYCRIRGDRTYRVTGNRGTSCHLELQATSGHHADGDYTSWVAVSQMSGDDLACDADGSFEIVLGGPARDRGWMPLDERASFLLVREYFADWESERPASLRIEQVGAGYPPAPLSTGQVGAHVDLLTTWLDAGARCWAGFAAGLAAGKPGRVEMIRPPADAAGLTGQAYGMAPFRCEPDEAVVLEVEPPPCRLWSISLCDRFLQSVDYDHRQSSLNRAQATLHDGRFVGVISHDDPGVTCWLDPGGHREGVVAVRYLGAEAAPPVEMRTVARAEIDDALPAGIARVTPTRRRETLRRRRLAVQRRFHG